MKIRSPWAYQGVQRRPLAARIRWDNVARIAFVASVLALVAWVPRGPGDTATLPPDVGLSEPRGATVGPPVSREHAPPRRARDRPARSRRPQRRQRPRRHERSVEAEVPPPPLPALPPAPPPAAGGEFGP